MRFKGECFRAHDPNWAWSALSGVGAALRGRRFNWPGLETLYLSFSFNTVFREVSGGFAHRLTPYILCSYDVDCEDVADLRTDADRAPLGVELSDLACAWGDALITGREPESWAVVRRLIADSYAGALVPSFANGATADDQNLVLWRWGPGLPRKVIVYDPTGKLPKNSYSGLETVAKAARKPESRILRSVHEAAAGLHRAGAIDEPAMREFDALCLSPISSEAQENRKALRERK